MLLLRRSLLLLLLVAGQHFASHPAVGAGARQVEVVLGADGALLDDSEPAFSQQALPPDTPTEGDSGAVKTSKSEQSSRPRASSVGAPAPHSTDHDKPRADDLYALQAEIDALDDMIRLQEEKLRVLREMRAAGAIDRASLDPNTLDKSIVAIDIRHSRDAIERRLDAVVAVEAEDAAAYNFETYFVERADTQAAESVADIKLLRTPLALDLIVLAYKSGRLEFYTSSFVKLLEMTPSDDLGSVRSIALEMYNRQPCLVVSHNASMLSTFAIHLTDLVQGHPTPKGAAGPQNQVPLRTVPYDIRVEKLGTAQLEARVTAFTLVEDVGRIVAGSESGTLSVFSTNGTRIDHLDAGTVHIHAVVSQHRRIAFSDGSNFVVTGLGGGFARNLIRCHGSSDSITSLAFDTQQNDVLYAGTKGGDVLVFRFKWGSSSSDQAACQLLSRATMTTRSKAKHYTDVTLKVVKGYVLAAGPSELTVFNMSRATQAEAPSLVPITALKTSNAGDNGPLLFDFAQGAHESSFVYLSADQMGNLPTVKLFHSFLTSPAEQRDFPWVFAMYMVTALVVVIAMQFYSRRNPERSPSPWDAPNLSHRMPLGKYGKEIARPSFDLNRSQASSISSRIARQQGKLDDYAVGDAFEEEYRHNSAYEEDENRPTYHSFSDELRQHLASSARKERG